MIRLFATASGAMLDFRYRVVDADKAAPLFEKGAKAYLINEATRASLEVPSSPKTGPLRSGKRPETGRAYFIIFSNLDRSFHRGDLVSLVVGNTFIPNLLVE